jgi:hypothetical protein
VRLNPLVTVFRDKYAVGWPRAEQGERGYVRPLGVVLDRDYRTDAHFVAYQSPNDRRLVVEAIDAGAVVTMNIIVFDMDCAEVHGTGVPVPPAWRRALRDKVQAMQAQHPGGFFYETRGGARLLYGLAEPAVLRTQEDATGWARDYVIAAGYLRQRFGIDADPACADWQRHYRCPRATRDRGRSPENHPYFGNAHDVGELRLSVTWGEVEEVKKRHPRKFQEQRPSTPYAGVGDGLLYYALKRRGDIVRDVQRHRQRGWIVRCPNRGQHSKNSDGTDATVLYPPSRGPFGFIHCLHAHCVDLTQQQWLDMFSKSEIEAAERDAGITRAA